MIQSLKSEIKKLGSLSLFFFICYGYILIIVKLFIKEETAVDIAIFGKTAIYALVSAKSVAIMDMTPLLNRFSGAARYRRVLYKTSIYVFAVLILSLLENIFHAFRETKALIPALTVFMETRSFSRFLGILMCVSIVFLIHNIFQEFDHYLGKGNLSKFFFKSHQ